MPAATPETPQLSLNLAMAVVASSHAPVLLLDANRVVVGASQAFCDAFDIDPDTVMGQEFSKLGGGEWAVAQLQSLMKATASGLAEVKNYEFDLKREGRAARCLVLNAHKLNYGEGEPIRLLLAIADVTDARIAEKMTEDLIRDKGTLLQELQHRVANSLQIIASVLMQSAKRVQSDEARKHLHEAHHRVMSVAAIQKQLAVSSIDRVSLKPYLTQLCESIGASMIHDPDQISLEVSSDESRVSAEVSVSLGLIVTELVINALKHAFPEGRQGKIIVDYGSEGPAWTLSVVDDGVGMPKAPTQAAAKAGLGTNIVQALAKQLEARITIFDAEPGTAVSLEHGDAETEDLAPEAV
ncbi:PAS domain-containing protein [Sphingomonas suaedae]|uniref:histidine kinase n=1 Tax=Sphingomonas suaedae TaxID=2599297 RepID=A0A518RFB0_9SPHN|nr:histidine kinase dimerization/phosphoacceptor domain -containing protein [Sphingomonas suaedae]QDX26113.1 PAS domain-containing protein [Sphingomonas suaedae]